MLCLILTPFVTCVVRYHTYVSADMLYVTILVSADVCCTLP